MHCRVPLWRRPSLHHHAPEPHRQSRDADRSTGSRRAHPRRVVDVRRDHVVDVVLHDGATGDWKRSNVERALCAPPRQNALLNALHATDYDRVYPHLALIPLQLGRCCTSPARGSATSAARAVRSYRSCTFSKTARRREIALSWAPRASCSSSTFARAHRQHPSRGAGGKLRSTNE